MIWLSIITAILRLIGLAQWANSLLASYEARKQSQEVANAPRTKQELIDDLNRGDL